MLTSHTQVLHISQTTTHEDKPLTPFQECMQVFKDNNYLSVFESNGNPKTT